MTWNLSKFAIQSDGLEFRPGWLSENSLLDRFLSALLDYSTHLDYTFIENLCPKSKHHKHWSFRSAITDSYHSICRELSVRQPLVETLVALLDTCLAMLLWSLVLILWLRALLSVKAQVESLHKVVQNDGKVEQTFGDPLLGQQIIFHLLTYIFHLCKNKMKSGFHNCLLQLLSNEPAKPGWEIDLDILAAMSSP